MNVFDRPDSEEYEKLNTESMVPLYNGVGEKKVQIGWAKECEDGSMQFHVDPASDMAAALALPPSAFSIRPESVLSQVDKVYNETYGQEALFETKPHEHLPVQHRDGKPRWCNECGLTADRKTPTAQF